MLILAQFCKWASCYQTTWAMCSIFLNFYRSNNIQGQIVCTDKGLFINDITQYWALLDPPPSPPMSSNVIFWLTPLPSPLGDVIYEQDTLSKYVHLGSLNNIFVRHNSHLKGGWDGVNQTLNLIIFINL